MSYLRKRWVLCVGNCWHFFTLVFMNMGNITFQVLRLSTFVFTKCSEIICFFWSSNVCPTSQTVVQLYFTIGPMYLSSGLSGYWGWNCHTYSNCGKVAYVYLHNAGLLLGHRQTSWTNIEATSVICPVIAVDAGVEESCVRSVLEKCWASVVHDWPALKQQWAATLAQH